MVLGSPTAGEEGNGYSPYQCATSPLGSRTNAMVYGESLGNHRGRYLLRGSRSRAHFTQHSHVTVIRGQHDTGSPTPPKLASNTTRFFISQINFTESSGAL